MLRRREGLSERALPDELVLYDPETDKAYLLNRSAAAIWDLCDGERSMPELAAELAGGVPGEILLQEVASAVERLYAEGLLEPCRSGPGKELR
jgi:coenzyme PQQ synthesis protein D (PqqD)